MPSRAPRAATIRSHASATSSPPATANPSTAAISGLSAERWVMPAKPRPSTYGRSPVTNAFRSMPGAEALAGAGEDADATARRRASSSSSAAAMPCGDGGVDRVALVRAVDRDQQDPVAALGQDRLGSSLMPRTISDPARARRAAPPGRPRRTSIPRAPASTRACGLIICAASTPRQDVERRVEPDPLEVARELLDRLDPGDPLDLDRHPLVVGVAAHQVDRADVGRPLAAHEPEPLAAPLPAARPAAPGGGPRRRPWSAPCPRRASPCRG